MTPPGRQCARIVKPRKPKTNANKPIIVVDVGSEEWITEEGETGTLSQLVCRLGEFQSSIFVINGAAEFVSICNDYYKTNPYWQASVTPAMREKWRPVERAPRGVTHRMFTNLTIVNWFGFTYSKARLGSKTKATRTNITHIVLDPITFADRATGKQPKGLAELLQWGKEIRDYCISENLCVRATQGSIARQYLKDARFYPADRRKVPRATNDKARDYIGCNHYEVRARIGKAYQGKYIDQHAAHHYQTQSLQLPDANYLYGYGSFRTMETLWKTDPNRIRKFLQEFKGLVYGEIHFQPEPGRWMPDYLRSKETTRRIFFYTNELDLLHSLGVKVTGIIAAWGSFHTDTGLPAFAKHARGLIDSSEYTWIKPLLLSVYGCLATRPKTVQVGFIRSDSGMDTTLPAGRRSLAVKLHRTTKEIEPVTNNVIHRGMIEAATRTESLMYANWLQKQGIRVLAIYVDAIITEDDGIEIPLFAPWEYKKPLSSLRFISDNAFTSIEMTKVPGNATRDTVLALAGGRQGIQRPSRWSREDLHERRMELWLGKPTRV